ncbi:hypothetical protein CONPUDRAFT_144982 [Coniophora puteana RWD-64-598 SS2]|uniref:F-box domain-containing protein n=1 Tax=Coniophora puteana (strain RWD-64-598) TaxID=741705 RepID=A0A5M3MKU9_CONPW|nr:uncharacterized protein CONPUDRAFT_144982 [Coniophora puteana RWD-64-598 SS2]EIW79852.1 hypothetical protein CONPUDRAFT_144982 [Coniophora puteana RWD-64-598 SS2]
MCLPQDLWKTEVRATRNGGKEVRVETLIFQRAMLRSDWRILESNASRVRTLILRGTNQSSGTVSIDPDALNSVSFYCGSFLFPQLRKLIISPPGNFMKFPGALVSRLYFGPLLEDVVLQNVDSSVCHDIVAASQACPMLRSLRILFTVIEPCNQLPDLLTDVAERLQNLKALSVTFGDFTISHRSIVALAVSKMRSLESLRLYLAKGITRERNHDPFSNLPIVYLPRLTHMSVTACPTDIEETLLNFNLTGITAFSAGFQGITEAAAVEKAVSSITIKLPEKIQSWELALTTFDFLENTGNSSLGSLSRFRDLTNVTLRSIKTSFTDDQVAALVFPCLCQLHLFAQYKSLGPPITFRGVGFILRNCPRLIYLTLAINAMTHVNEPHNTLTFDANCSSLISWNVAGSRIDDPEFTVRHVVSLMPRLREIVTTGDVKAMRKLWAKVDDLLDGWKGVSMR